MKTDYYFFMNYFIMRYYLSKELATVLSKLLTITVAFYVL